MKIDKNLALSLAVSALVGGLVGWLVSNDDKSVQNKSESVITASATPTPTASQESVNVSEEANPYALPARNIWTYDCEIPVQLPESIFLTCANGGWYIYKIKWQSWDESEATATGLFSQKVCEPDCASGYRVEAPVELSISTSAKAGKKIFLTDLVMSASTEKDFESGDRTLTWDLGEFAMMMESQ